MISPISFDYTDCFDLPGKIGVIKKTKQSV